MTGTVRFFNDRRGYGFIRPSDGSEDIYVHYSEIAGEGWRTLAEGDEVAFEVDQDAKGRHAEDVALVADIPKRGDGAHGNGGFCPNL